MADIIITETRGQLWKKRFMRPFRYIGGKVDRRPFLWFIILLVLLTVAIVAGSFLRKPDNAREQTEIAPKEVQLFAFDKNLEIIVQAQVDKTGVTKIIAQQGGIVSDIPVKTGSKVQRGQTIVRMANNYANGNIASIQRQIAQKNYDNTVETYSAQKDAIAKQRDLAEKGKTQSEELREIGRISVSDTRSLVNQNQSALDSLNNQIKTLQETNVGGANDLSIAQATSSRNMLEGTLVQLKSGLRTAEYQSDDDEEPASIANIQKDLTLRQLELQEKGLDVARDIAQLNLRVAQISESLMAPASPFAGVVERIYVTKGENVAPGTVIAQIRANTISGNAVALVSKDTAQQISKLEPSTMTVGTNTKEVMPLYISQEATDGTLHSIEFIIPTDFMQHVPAGGTVQIRIPLVKSEANLYVPIDAIYQTGNTSYVFIAQEEEGKLKAIEKEIKLGKINGNYSEVIEGIGNKDKIILNRNVLSGDIVQNSK